jgi:uncharacterized membrane protein
LNRSDLLEQRGAIGKIIIIWLLIVALFGIAAIDTASILFTKYRVTDLAGTAASTAADSYQSSKNQATACQAAAQYVASQDSQAHIPNGGCTVNSTTGMATVTVRKIASTIAVKHISPLRKYERVTSTQSSGPAVL